MRRLPFFIATAFTLLTAASATVPFGTEPWWESDESEYGTGGMFYDIDGDGYLEFVTGNGNDMDEDQEGVYDNAAGVVETTASWRSADYGYGAQIDLADVDGDGDLDLAVAN
ncbi:MAG: VCBS repeat-containing protein, partial [Candidatus Coatesbacteria bacterium]